MKSRGWTLEDAKAASERVRQGQPAPKREGISSLLVSLPRLLPGLNGPDGLIRQHFRTATAVKEELLIWVKQQRYGTFGTARVQVVCTRHYCGNPMDYDNAAASFKYLLDALVKAGVLADDGPKIIDAMTFRQVRCATKKEQHMTIKIASCSLMSEEAAIKLF